MVRWTVHYIRKKLLCEKWLLLLLAQIDLEHFFFSKELTKEILKPKRSMNVTFRTPTAYLTA